MSTNDAELTSLSDFTKQIKDYIEKLGAEI